MTSRIFIQTISLCQKMWKRLFVKTTNALYYKSKITFVEEEMYRVEFGKGSKITIQPDFEAHLYVNGVLTELKDIGIQFSSLFFFYKIYSLCKNNAISKILNKLLPLYCAHKYYINSDYTLVRVTKTTVLQR